MAYHCKGAIVIVWLALCIHQNHASTARAYNHSIGEITLAYGLVDPSTQRRRLNSEAVAITQSGTIGQTPLKQAGLTGRGEVVGIADSGLYDKSCFFNGAQSNLQKNTSVNPSMRKVIQYIAYADGNPSAHGTHVTGSVAGQCDRASGRIYDGMAPEAKIHFFDIGVAGSPAARIPNNLSTGMFALAKAAGAAIHTNGWGSNTRAYTSESRDVDAFAWENEEFVIVVMAGSSLVQSPGTAKNCITVGATSKPNIQDIANFSALGPTLDGRIKPDVVAPGENIVSATVGDCRVVYANGTAMATSLVAGGVALVRQYFREGWYPSGSPTPKDAFTPSGALLKAMTVHAGRRITGETRGNSSYPSVVQGFGRVDLSSVLTLSSSSLGRGLWVHSSRLGQTRVQLQQGQTFQKTFTVNNPGNLKVTLVWMDAPSSLASQKNLVNNLDLRVVRDGVSYYPNGANVPDALNNVEVIEILASPGNYSVVVIATEILSQPPLQPYALVVTGPFDDGRTTTTTSTMATSTTTTSTSTKASPAGFAPRIDFEKIESGSCVQRGLFPISDVQTCQDAAVQLGLAETTVFSVNSINLPEGCFTFRQGRDLFLSTNPANIGNGANLGREPICSIAPPSSYSASTASRSPKGAEVGDNAVALTGGVIAAVVVLSLMIAICAMRRMRNRPQKFAA
jgi:hypothetical protein